MLPLLGLFVIVGLPGAVAASDAPPTDDPLATLREVFLHPPEEAKPRGYWVWPHGNFDYATLRTELEEFKAKGLGGVDIFDLGIRDRDHVIPPGPGFLSVEQVDGIAYALEQAKRLGLKLGLIVSSSWNAGGTWTPPEFASMNLVAWREEVTGPQHYDRVLPFPELPDSFKKPYGTYPLQVPRDDSGEPRFHREVAVLACPLDATGRIVDPRQVRVLGDQVEAGGRLVCDLPEGRWLILRTVLANFGQQLWLPSDGSQGLTMDHFSKEATRHHFATVMNRLEARVGPLRDTALERLYLASYEANADVIWTPGFQEAFAKQHGYRIEPFLPALFGVEVENADVTGRFLHDYRRTVSDLFVNHLYREASRLCRERGLVLCSESGGPGAPLHDVPTEDLQALGAVDVMRGEFWNGRTNQLTPEGFEELQVVKPIASAAHIYGHRIVEMEAFTSTIHWSEGPADFKPLADRAFCEGMTRVVYHTMTHNLPEAGVPGWTYQAGTHMNTNLPWWNLSQQLHAYLARCSALLMQGWFVADVAYYRGSEVPNFGKPKHRRPGLGFGHDYDDLNTEVLLTARVDESGRIVLPSGMSYALLVLPPDDDRMELPVARHVETLVHAGATILGPRPKRTYGLADYRQQEAELGEIAVRLWGKEPGNRSVDRVVGQGRVVAEHPELELLVTMGLGPDLAVWPEAAENQLDFIHRRTDRGEIYFLRNIGTNALSFEADFRARGARPEAWDPVDGTMKPLAAFVGTEQGTRVPLHLEGHGSIFVVFPGGPETGPQITRVSRQGQRWFPRGTAGCAGFDATIEPDGSVRFRAAQPGEYTLAFADGTERRVRVRPDPEPIEITGPWEVRFPWGWDVPVHQEFATLQSWTESTNAATRAFSGSARYARQFDLPAERLRGEGRVMLDLGEVREVARVHLNGRDLGLSSFAPHVLDVTESIRAGENTLVIEVANTWLNRLRLDDTLPEAQRKTHTNIGGPVGGKRWRDVSPSPSGLLGPLRLRFEDDARIHVAPTQAG